MLLSQILPNSAHLHPSNYAIKHNNETLSYEQLLSQVNRVAYGFYHLGIQPGDRIALLSHPCPHLAIAEIAAVAIGAIPVTVFPGLTSSEQNQILQDAAPVAIVYDPNLLNLSESISSLRIPYSITCNTGQGPYSIDNFIATSPPLTKWYEANPDDIALIIYTGGTTGRSKGVMHSHRSISYWSFMSPDKGVDIILPRNHSFLTKHI